MNECVQEIECVNNSRNAAGTKLKNDGTIVAVWKAVNL